MKRSPSLSCLICLLLALSVTVPAFGQKKPPPGTGGGEPAANSGGTKAPPPTQGKVYAPSQELIEEFQDAVEQDNFPKVLMMIGQDARAQGRGAVGTRGSDAGGADPARQDVGDTLLDFDRTGITEVLENALGVYLQEGFEEFVDPSALATAERTEILNKVGRDDIEGLTTMAQKLNADVVIYIRFQELPLAERPENNERFRCTAEIKHLRRRSTRKVTPFDWDGPIDVRNARRYAGALAEEFMKQYIAMVRGRARSMEIAVRLEKLPSNVTSSQVRKWLTLEGAAGTPKISDTTTDPDNLITVEGSVRHRGEASDVEEAIRQAARADGIELGLVKGEEARIILEARGSVSSAAGVTATGVEQPCWFAVTDPEDKAPARIQFRDMVKKQPQTMCIVVNWVLDPAQYKLDHARYVVNGSTYFFSGWSLPNVSIVTGEPRGDNTAVGTQTVSMEKLGNELKQVFSDAGIEVKEFDAVNAAMAKEADKLQSLKGGEEDVVKVLRNTFNTDVLLWAKVRIVRQAELNNAAMASISLTLYDTTTGRFIAATNWDGDASVLKRPETRGIPARYWRDAKSGEFAARYIAGNIMCKWLKKSPVTEFQVHGAKTFTETRSFAESVGTIPGVTVSNIRHDNALGTFLVTYEGNLDELKLAIDTKASEYPGARKGKLTEATAGKIVWTFD